MILLIYHSYNQHHLSSLLISSYDHYFFISVFTVTQHEAISTPLRESYALQGILLVLSLFYILFDTSLTRGGQKVLQFGMLFSSPTRVLLCLVRTGSDKFTNRAAPLLCSLLSLKGVTSGCRWQ